MGVGHWGRCWLLALAIAPLTGLSAQADSDAFHHEIHVENATRWYVTVTVKPKSAVLEGQGSTFLLPPGKYMVIARYTDAKGFVSPVELMTVSGTVRNKHGKESTIGVLMMRKQDVDATHRRYYYQVMGGGSSVGFSF